MEAEIKFSETVLPGRGVQLTEKFRTAGVITQIMFHFPPGCAGLVDMRLNKDNMPFYPIKGFIALNDATPVYYVQANYYQMEPLMLEILNHDSINAHTPTCTVVIRYKKQWWEETE